jgi:hypothetical protein
MEMALIRPHMREWAHRSMARVGRGLPTPPDTARGRRLLVVHLDGTPRSVLEEALASGRMPFLGRLLNQGAFRMDQAFWGTPASTPCFQAGLLYGHRHPNLPAYQWFDRELGQVIRMNVPKQALSIESRMGRMGTGSLLERGGTAYLSLFRAHAKNDLSMPSLAHLRKMAGALGAQLRGLRTVQRQGVLEYLGTLFAETFRAGQDAARWVRRVRDHRHEVQFLLSRFFITQLAWSLAENRALIDMVRGVPVIYLVFGNFDEVAHRRGPFSEEARSELRRADAALEELYTMGQLVEKPYDLVIVTDHGHVDSAPFERRTGRKLADWLGDPSPIDVPAGVLRALADGRYVGSMAQPSASPAGAPGEARVVIEAGNFSHVYLSRARQPLEALEILARHPGVLARAVTHPDLAIVALRRGKGAVAVIGGGVYGPDELDAAPLAAGFSRRAVRDLLEELPRMPTAGDLVLYGQSLAPGGTVGFAWEFGSHGGLTTTETDSVVIWPAAAPLDLRGLSHSTQLHQKLSEVYRH